MGWPAFPVPMDASSPEAGAGATEGGRNGMVNPSTMEMYLGLMRVLKAAHKSEELLSVCEEGLKRDDQMTPHFHLYAAVALMRLGRGEEALDNAQKAVEGLNEDSMRLTTRLLRLDALAYRAVRR